MKRLIITILFCAFLTTSIIFEQTFIDKTFDGLKERVEVLAVSIEECGEEAIDTDENKKLGAEILDYWHDREKTLCLLIKHAELFQITDSLLYLKNFIEFDNKEEAFVGIEKVKYLIDTHNYVLGTSLQNII
ncbi:MAG: DUF4363 family protein [Christensenellaceae bacterium]|jgi:hypothetical protein|nr:DUF4363 family protein [Christensenellaceae bacterium]